MKNVLSDSQKFKLANWLVENKDKGFSRTSAAWTASSELAFDVTYSNMQSAEKTTGISLVKVPEVKESKINENIENMKLTIELLNLRVLKLHSLVMSVLDKVGLGELQNIEDIINGSYIKPSAPKPTICHKHGEI